MEFFIRNDFFYHPMLRPAGRSFSQAFIVTVNSINMKFIYLICGIILTLFSSCKKKSETEKENVINTFIIEYNNPNIILHDINPDVTIWSLDPVYYPIDLNADGWDDFRLWVVNRFSYGGLVLDLSYVRIETSSNDSYVFVDSIIPHVDLKGDSVTHQSLIDSVYPKIFSLGDTISIHEKWRKGSFLIIRSGWKPPPNTRYYEGKWWSLDKKYIGIKCRDFYGWIKIGVPDSKHGSLKIYEFAVSKYKHLPTSP